MQIVHDNILLAVSNLITNTFGLKVSEKKQAHLASKVVYCRSVRVEYTVDISRTFEVMMGFTDCTFNHLLPVLLPEVQLLHEEIDREMLCNNILGLVIFKLYDDIRNHIRNFEYHLPFPVEFSNAVLDKSEMFLSGMRNGDCCLFVGLFSSECK